MVQENKKQYLSLLSEIIAKESVVFGPDIAILKARSIVGLVLDANGNVVDIKGYAADATQELVKKYLELSYLVAKTAIDSIFEKYPQIKKFY